MQKMVLHAGNYFGARSNDRRNLFGYMVPTNQEITDGEKQMERE